MKTSLLIEGPLEKAVLEAEKSTPLKQATLLRMAIEVGLPSVVSRFQEPRPEGYFASDYAKTDGDRDRAEKAAGRLKQKAER